MPIVLAPTGRDLTITKIATDDRTRKHLANLGITINSTIRVISSTAGNVICAVKEGRLALDRDVAVKILVA